MNFKTREEWLVKAAIKLSPLIVKAGFEMPLNVHYSCGFPSTGGLARKKRTIGQCWAKRCTKDEMFEIMISPTIDDVVDVLATNLHEMIHAAVGLEEKHGGNFRKCAKAVGLTGKMTATVPGEELRETLKDIATKLGPYPHGRLSGGKHDGPPKQGTRLIKLSCCGCGYVLRTTQKWIETGLPTCHCGEEFTTEEQE